MCGILVTSLVLILAMPRPSPQIKKHAWYRGFDWEALESQSMEAPNPTELLEVHIHTSIIHHMQDPHGGHL